MEQLLFLILIVVAGSAFFSGLEAALFSVSLNYAKVLREQNKPGAKSLVKIKESPSRPIVVIVIFNNLFNIVGSILVGFVATNILGSAWLGAVSAALTVFIIVFGEIVPKTIGERFSSRIALLFAKTLLFSTRVFMPFILLVEVMTNRLKKAKHTVSEEELQILSHLGHLEGEIEKDERDMIHKVFTLNDITARDIMTPRTVICAFQANDTIGDFAEEIYSLRNSRLPVYENDLDNIVGICHRADLLIALGRGKKKTKIKDYLQNPLYVDEEDKTDELLPLFQRERAHLAIVKDKFGGTSGVVTLEDVLEQLVGEIVDETDKHTDMRERAHEKSKNSS